MWLDKLVNAYLWGSFVEGLAINMSVMTTVVPTKSDSDVVFFLQL